MLPFHFIDHVGQSIRLGIEIGRIDLLKIACKYHFCTLSRTSDDGFHLVRSQILRLVNNTKSFGKASPANESQCFDCQLTRSLHFLDKAAIRDCLLGGAIG